PLHGGCRARAAARAEVGRPAAREGSAALSRLSRRLGAVEPCDVPGREPAVAGGAMRPAGEGVLPGLLAAVGQQVDEREGLAELLGASSVGEPGAVGGVAVAQEHVDRVSGVGRRAYVCTDRAAGGRVPLHLIADLVAV